MSAGKGGGLTSRIYDSVTSIVAVVFVCTLVLVALFGAGPGIAKAGKGVDVASVSFGGVIGFIGRGVDGITKGQKIAAKTTPAAKAPATGKI